MRGGGLLTTIYLVVGVLVAVSRGYFENIGQLEPLLSALLAVVLWPLLFAGIDLKVNL